jgi:UDP-N-acetylglucosamine:LPS N-acetylglucosamine transferase
MQGSYRHANLALRIAPGLPLTAFSKVVDIGPIAETRNSHRDDIRKHLRVNDSERLVLLAFGGIALNSLPWEAMGRLQGYHFIVSSPPDRPSPRIHVASTLSHSFNTLMASVDLVMTKPGYGTIVEAVTLEAPVVYVRRYNFADEAPLVDFLHRYGCGHELSLKDFQAGNWQPALDAIRCTSASVSPPSPTGAADAARFLMPFLR